MNYKKTKKFKEHIKKVNLYETTSQYKTVLAEIQIQF